MKQRLYYILPAFLLFVGAFAYGQFSQSDLISQLSKTGQFTSQELAEVSKLLPQFLAQAEQSGGVPSQPAGTAAPSAEEIIQPSLEEIAALIKPKITLTVNPASPLEGGNVTVSAEPFRIPNAERGDYLWLVNNALVSEQSGLGKTSLTFSAPKAGNTASVKLILTAPDKQKFSASISVPVIGLELDWSADTYVPFNYSGRPLYSAGSRVRVSATPLVSNENPKNLVYEWFLDDEKQFGPSGFGKQEFSFFKNNERIGAEHSVKVKISNQTRSVETEKIIFLKAIQPEVVLYQTEQGNGSISSSQVLTEYTLQKGRQIDFIAVPYFFSASRPEDLAYEWTFNGTRLTGSPKNPDILTLKVPEGAIKGTYDLIVSVNTPGKILQNASFRVTINVR